MVKPWVSIVVPSQNHAVSLLETIRSLQRQVESGWECFIMDNHSQDSAWFVAEMLGREDVRIHSHRHKVFKGDVQHIRDAVQQGNSPYVMLLLPGQVLAPNVLTLMRVAIDRYGDAALFTGVPQAGIHAGWDNGIERWSGGALVRHVLVSGNTQRQHAPVVFRRDILDETTAFDGTNSWTQEFEAMVRVGSRYPWVTVSGVEVSYNRIPSKVLIPLLRSGDLAVFEAQAVARLLNDHAVSSAVGPEDVRAAWARVRTVELAAAFYQLTHGRWPRRPLYETPEFQLKPNFFIGEIAAAIQFLYSNWRMMS